jgi:hypothetical protein
MNPLTDPEFVSGLRGVPMGVTPAVAQPAHDISGTSPQGVPLEIAIDRSGAKILLAFLHTHCQGCEEFWRTLGDPAAVAGLRSGPSGEDVVVVVVTKGPGSVRTEEISRWASVIHPVPVVMSDQAWLDYRVHSYPFFVLVDGTSRVVLGETVGFGWSDVLATVRSCDCAGDKGGGYQ